MATKTKTETKPMTEPQKRYARQRVESLISTKMEALRDEPQVSRLEIFRAEVKAGRYTLDKSALLEATGHDSVFAVVKLRRYPKGLNEHMEGLKAAAESRRKALRKEGQRLIDTIVLGGSADALKLIQAFEDKNF